MINMHRINYKNIPENPVTLNKPKNSIVYRVVRNSYTNNPVYNYYNKNTFKKLKGKNPMTRRRIIKNDVKLAIVHGRPLYNKAIETMNRLLKAKKNKEINKIYKETKLVNLSLYNTITNLYNKNVATNIFIKTYEQNTINPNHDIIKLMKKYKRDLLDKLKSKQMI